jgi:hypothetical protein
MQQQQQQRRQQQEVVVNVVPVALYTLQAALPSYSKAAGDEARNFVPVMLCSCR